MPPPGAEPAPRGAAGEAAEAAGRFPWKSHLSHQKALRHEVPRWPPVGQLKEAFEPLLRFWGFSSWWVRRGCSRFVPAEPGLFMPSPGGQGSEGRDTHPVCGGAAGILQPSSRIWQTPRGVHGNQPGQGCGDHEGGRVQPFHPGKPQEQLEARGQRLPLGREGRGRGSRGNRGPGNALGLTGGFAGYSLCGPRGSHAWLSALLPLLKMLHNF